MSVSVLTAVSPRLETAVARGLESAPGVTVVRRCADLAELLSTAAAGVAEVAVVSVDLKGLDREALRLLAGQRVRVAGFVDGDEEAERRLRQLGVATFLRPSDDPATVATILADLTAGAPPPPELPEARATSARPGDLERRPGRVVAVWGPTGAPGRTTVAVTLAAHLARRHEETLLVDLDTWGASVAQVLGLVDEAPGVAAAARSSEHGTLDLPALSRVAPEVVPGLRVLTGLPRADRWPELRGAAVEDVLGVARLLADHVVVDCGFALEDDEELSYDTSAPRRNAATLTALGLADVVVAVGAGDPVGLQRLVRGVQDLAALGTVAPVVVVNKTRAAVAGADPERSIDAVLSRFAGMTDITYLPWAPEDCDAALLAGRTLVEQAPESALTSAVGVLANRVLGEPVESGRARSATRRGRRVSPRRGLRVGARATR